MNDATNAAAYAIQGQHASLLTARETYSGTPAGRRGAHEHTYRLVARLETLRAAQPELGASMLVRVWRGTEVVFAATPGTQAWRDMLARAETWKAAWSDKLGHEVAY